MKLQIWFLLALKTNHELTLAFQNLGINEWRHSGHVHLLYTVYVDNKPLRLVSDFSVQQSKGERKKYSSSSRFSPIRGNVVKTKVWWVSAQKAAQMRGCRPEQTGNWCWEVLSDRRVTRERINMQLWHQVVEPPPPPCFSSVWITAAALQTQQTRSHPVQDRIKKQGKRQRRSGTRQRGGGKPCWILHSPQCNWTAAN